MKKMSTSNFAYKWGHNFELKLQPPSPIFAWSMRWPVWPDWEIYWTLGNFSKPLATINLPKSPTFLGNFFKVVKIYHFSNKIIFVQLLWTFGNFLMVTLFVTKFVLFMDYQKMLQIYVQVPSELSPEMDEDSMIWWVQYPDLLGSAGTA